METKELQQNGTDQAGIIKSLVLDGDISKMSDDQKVDYYKRFCESLGLNPLTQPFQIIKFQGKERLYATKDCTEQLRKIYKVSISEVTGIEFKDTYMVTAKAIDGTGKTDAATGLVSIAGLKGEALANAVMKAETKAKRRVTLSICGLGILDETELESIPADIETKITMTENVIEIPEELKLVIAESDLANLSNIYKTNTDFHSNKEFMNLLNNRKKELNAVTQPVN